MLNYYFRATLASSAKFFNPTNMASPIKLGQAAAYTGEVKVYDSTSSLTSLSILSDGHMPENGIKGFKTNTASFPNYENLNKNGLPIFYKTIPSSATPSN